MIANRTGMIGLLTPSGIAADKNAAKFFKQISTNGHLKSLFDFENRRSPLPNFFPDIHPKAKFVCLIFSRDTFIFRTAKCAFFLKDVAQVKDSERVFVLTADDFLSINPNTGTAPIFLTQRDANLTTSVYKKLPVLVDRREGGEKKA